ncbi:MAG: hypothetical protein ACKV2Q_35680 [Planctomycetaceae bacterium]
MQPSRHDKQRRLGQSNSDRQHTERARFPLVGWLAAAVARMAGTLDARMCFRLAIIVAGMLLADDRRTASSWFMALLRSWKLDSTCRISSDSTRAPETHKYLTLAESLIALCK